MFLSAEAVEVLVRGQAGPVDVDLAARRPVEGSEQVEQGRFAAAAGAHDGQIFSAADVEGDVGKCTEGAPFIVAANRRDSQQGIERGHGVYRLCCIEQRPVVCIFHKLAI